MFERFADWLLMILFAINPPQDTFRNPEESSDTEERNE